MSNIDPSNPTEGQATTQSVRDNFQAAADEIDANTAAAAAAQAAADAAQADADAAQAKADNSVQLTGNQTIAGQKTFTDDATFSASVRLENDGKLNWKTAAGAARVMMSLDTGDDLIIGNTGAGDGNDRTIFNTENNPNVLILDGSNATFGGVPSTTAAQGTTAEALTRKDYVDAASSGVKTAFMAMATDGSTNFTGGSAILSAVKTGDGQYRITSNIPLAGGAYVVAATISDVAGALSVRAFDKTPTAFTIQTFNSAAATLDAQVDMTVTWNA
jgi:hypothetical protein